MADFTGKRNMTSGVNADIPPILQIAMWVMLNQEIVSGRKMDYLQVFNLKPVMEDGKKRQEIELTQEQPKRKRVMVTDADNTPISAKVFVIDSGEYVTMMLANEY